MRVDAGIQEERWLSVDARWHVLLMWPKNTHLIYLCPARAYMVRSMHPLSKLYEKSKGNMDAEYAQSFGFQV
jgi:hypothetical protein